MCPALASHASLLQLPDVRRQLLQLLHHLLEPVGVQEFTGVVRWPTGSDEPQVLDARHLLGVQFGGIGQVLGQAWTS